MINIATWVEGYKVRAFDWIDGENIYINIAYYKPGSNICQPPSVEKSFLILKDGEQIVREFLHSVVIGLMQGTYNKKAISQIS